MKTSKLFGIRWQLFGYSNNIRILKMDRIPNTNSTIRSQLFEYRIIRIIRSNSGPRVAFLWFFWQFFIPENHTSHSDWIQPDNVYDEFICKHSRGRGLAHSSVNTIVKLKVYFNSGTFKLYFIACISKLDCTYFPIDMQCA